MSDERLEAIREWLTDQELLNRLEQEARWAEDHDNLGTARTLREAAQRLRAGKVDRLEQAMYAAFSEGLSTTADEPVSAEDVESLWLESVSRHEWVESLSPDTPERALEAEGQEEPEWVCVQGSGTCLCPKCSDRRRAAASYPQNEAVGVSTEAYIGAIDIVLDRVVPDKADPDLQDALNGLESLRDRLRRSPDGPGGDEMQEMRPAPRGSNPRPIPGRDPDKYHKITMPDGTVQVVSGPLPNRGNDRRQ